ncbi:MAG: condensation domain-containing protein, partial [Cyanobacteria bacterium J06642_11]
MSAPDLKNLSPEQKRELLAKLLEKKAAAKQPQRTTQTFPLSFAQQRLWFIDQLQPGQAVYTIPAALRLQGNLSKDILQRCLNEIVARHEVLRTQFMVAEGEPSQQIQGLATVDLPLVILNGEPSSLAQQIRPYLKALVESPFDLTTGPLLRCRLIRLSDTDHVLALGVHHIVADYWSLRVLMKEIALLYQAFSQNKPSPLPALQIQYADYAVWQHNQQTNQSQLDYWLEKLANPPSILQLPTDHPRPAVQTFRGARHSFALSKSLSEKLSALGQQHQATLFITLLTAFKVLLYRYSSQTDILVGSTVTNRDRTELQNLIGLFVNNLVFRTQVEPQLTFRQLLDQVKQIALDAYAHQSVSFEQVVDALQVERHLSHNALFQVMFILHNTPKASVSLPELTVSALEFTNNASRFDLSLDMYETEAGLTGVFEYNTDLFDADTIARLATHFETLLEGIVAAPDTAVEHLPLLSPSQIETLAAG